VFFFFFLNKNQFAAREFAQKVYKIQIKRIELNLAEKQEAFKMLTNQE